MTEYKYTLFHDLYDADCKGSCKQLSSTWDGFCKFMACPVEHPQKDRVPTIVPCEFKKDGRRQKDDVIAYSMLVLDYDNTEKVVSIEDFVSRYQENAFFLHSSYSHGKNPHIPKFRVFLPMSRPMSAEEYLVSKPMFQRLYQHADPSGFDLSHPFNLPSYPPERKEHFFTHKNDGELLDVEPIIKHGRNMAQGKEAARMFISEERMKNSPEFKNDNSLQRAKDLLYNTRADIPRRDWINVGYALNFCFGNAGKDLFVTWSQTSTNPEHKMTINQLENQYDNLRDGYLDFGVIVNVNKKYSR